MAQIAQIVVAALLILLGLFVLRAQPRRKVNRAFAAQTLLLGGWVLGIAGLHTGSYPEVWSGLSFAFASMIPSAFFYFTSVYPTTERWPSRSFLHLTLVGGTFFAMLSAMSSLIIYDVTVDSVGVSRKAGALYPLFAIYFIATWCGALYILIDKWRRSRGIARSQLQYLVAGIIVGFMGGISANLILPLITGESTYIRIGPYFTLAYVALVGHAIIRHRLMDLRLFIHRGLTLAFAIIVSALPAGFLVAAFWPRLLTHLDATELVFVLGAIAIVTVLIPITRDVANRLLDRYVYRTHANYRRTVREASQVLTRVLLLNKLLAFISTTVVRSTAAEGVALYLREDGGFRCAVAEKAKDVEHFAAPAQAPIEVIAALETAAEPILTDEVARERDVVAMALYEQLTQASWALLLPVHSEDTLIAMLAVGPKLSGDPFYQEDLDLLMTLANQAGIAIKNAQLYAAVVVANEYLENIVAALESGVVAINAAGQIAMFNRAAEHLTGLPAEQAKSAGVTLLPACLADPLRATVDDGQPRTQPEVDLPTADGSASRPVICTTSAVRDPAGGVLGAVAVFSDLTPLKELEVERRRAERLAYFQALASGIAHEIKNPLVAIKTFVQLLPRRRDDERFLEEFGRISTREIERMQRLVDRLQTLSRPAGGPRFPIDLRVPLTHAFEFMLPGLEEKSLTATMALGTEPCVVLGNPGELEQLFLNLLLNAREATPAGGAVSIELTRSDSQVMVAVCDTGPGIPVDLLERVLEPFFTTKPRGSGLGLAVSAGIAQAHGARLRPGNRPSGGAIFTVEFPLPSVVSPVVA